MAQHPNNTRKRHAPDIKLRLLCDRWQILYAFVFSCLFDKIQSIILQPLFISLTMIDIFINYNKYHMILILTIL